MGSILTEIINILVSGITEYATGFGQGLGNAVEAIFLETTEGTTTLSTTGGIIVVFAALALAIGVTKLVFNWVTSLGASK